MGVVLKAVRFTNEQGIQCVHKYMSADGVNVAGISNEVYKEDDESIKDVLVESEPSEGDQVVLNSDHIVDDRPNAHDNT